MKITVEGPENPEEGIELLSLLACSCPKTVKKPSRVVSSDVWNPRTHYGPIMFGFNAPESIRIGVI